MYSQLSLRYLVAVDVPSILLEAGGRTKNTHRVADFLNKKSIAVMVNSLYQIQFFNRTLGDNTLSQIELISSAVDVLRVNNDTEKSFKSLYLENANLTIRVNGPNQEKPNDCLTELKAFGVDKGHCDVPQDHRVNGLNLRTCR